MTEEITSDRTVYSAAAVGNMKARWRKDREQVKDLERTVAALKQQLKDTRAEASLLRDIEAGLRSKYDALERAYKELRSEVVNG